MINTLSPPTYKLPGSDPLAGSGGPQINDLLNAAKNAATGNGPTASTARVNPVPSSPKTPGATGGTKSGTKAPSGSLPGKAPTQQPNYGLNTTSTKPFNPYQAETEGQFNQSVLAAARAQYEPQLQQYQGDIAAENAASPQRVNALNSIYGAYGQDAQDAFNETQQALNAMLTQNASGNQAAQGTLAAALSSAQAPSGQLSQMMGMTPESQSSPEPYNLAALGSNNAGQNELAQIAAGLMGTQGNNVANVGLEQSQQLDNESLRHMAALQGYRGQEDALAQTIPTDIANQRQTLLTAAQNASTANLQNSLATKEFGLTANNDAANQQLAQEQFGLTKQQDQITNDLNWAKVGQGQQGLNQQEQEIQANIASTNDKLIETTSGLQAKAAGNVQKIIQGYITPKSTDFVENHTNNVATGKTTTTRTISPTWTQSLDPKSLLQTIMTAEPQLNRNQALQAMTAVDIKYGYHPSITIGQWAEQQLNPVYKNSVSLPGSTGPNPNYLQNPLG